MHTYIHTFYLYIYMHMNVHAHTCGYVCVYVYVYVYSTTIKVCIIERGIEFVFSRPGFWFIVVVIARHLGIPRLLILEMLDFTKPGAWLMVCAKQANKRGISSASCQGKEFGPVQSTGCHVLAR